MFTFDVSQTLWKTIKSHLLLYEIGSQQTKHVVFNSCVIYFDRFPYRIFLGMLGKKKALSISTNKIQIWFDVVVVESTKQSPSTIPKSVFVVFFFETKHHIFQEQNSETFQIFASLHSFSRFFLPGIFGIPGEPHRPPTTPRLASFARKDLGLANE